jgi:rod shape-determining protein MreC
MILISRGNPHFVAPLRAGLQDLATPVMSTLTRPVDALRNASEWVQEWVELRAENQLLKTQNGQLMQWQSVAGRLQAENDALRKLITMVPDGATRYVAARIVGETGGPYMRSALINGGSTEGVKADQAVITGDGLVGRVMESGLTSARVLLLTDMNSRVPVIAEKSRERSILAGNNSPTLTLDYVPAASEMEVGERLLTSGDGGIFPPGIPVGVVTDMSGGTILVQPLVDWSRLEYVSVVDYTF